MFCSNCGTQVYDVSTYCFQCGSQVGIIPVPQPLLSRKQFYISSSETQMLYMEFRSWQKRAAVGFLMAFTAQTVILLSRLVFDWTMPRLIGMIPYIIAMIGFIIALVFLLKAEPSRKHLDKIYKAYVQWHKNTYTQ